jgi:hypothetical protein
MSHFAEEARRLALLGYAVFPCIPKRKLPFALKAPNGCNSATTNDATIAEWWSEFPNSNIGLKCKNVLVIDVDKKGGKDGTKDIANIIGQLGPLPPCPISVTPTGGFHLFFAKPETEIVGKTGVIWNGVSTGIDIRVGNQYVVVPPSFRDDVPISDGQFTTGSYSWKSPLVSVSELPTLSVRWIDEFLPHKNATKKRIVPPLVIRPEGASTAVDRCRLYLNTVEPSISGQGGDKQLFKAACVIFWDFGLSESDGMPLLQEYNARCLPPWSQSRLDYKMNEVFHYPHEKERGYLPGLTCVNYIVQ